MAQLYKADEDVMKVIRELVANYHPHLALCHDQIAVVFKMSSGAKKGKKSAPKNTVSVAGKSGKASPLLGVLGDTEWRFIITLSQDVWDELGEKERVALLDHHLCACRADENPQNGEIKYSVAPPDVSFYRDEIERHGMWRTSGSPPSPDLMKELFGEDSDNV